MTTAPRELGRASYSLFTSPHHPPQKDHLPTLIVTPAGKPQHILYIYLHTNYNLENYLLTPSDAGDLCVAKLFPPHPESSSSSSSSGHGHGSSSKAVRCEASRNLRWSIVNTGVAMPTYKLTLPNPDGGEDQPLIQISKTNKNSPYWLMTYYTCATFLRRFSDRHRENIPHSYAGHLIPPNRVEFGRIEKSDPSRGGDGGTRVSITGKTDEQKAVWKILGEGNEDMVEWCVLCAALNIIDDEVREAARAAGHPIRPPPKSHPSRDRQNSASASSGRELHPTGQALNGALAGLSLGAPQTNGAVPPGRGPLKKTRSFDSRPVPPPGARDLASGRAPSPFMQQGPPPPSPGGPRRPSAPSAYDARPSPSLGGPRGPDRSIGPPRNDQQRPLSADPSPRMRGNSADPRMYGPPPGIGGPAPQRDPRDMRTMGPAPTAWNARPYREERSMPNSRVVESRAWPPPQNSPGRTSRAGPPPGLREQSSLAYMRSPSPVPSPRIPLPQPPQSASPRERGTQTRAAGTSRHGRTSSLDAMHAEDRSMPPASSPTLSTASHRDRPAREPSAYQPNQRRFEKPQASTSASSSQLAQETASALRHGVQLHDTPASRASDGVDASPNEQENAHSATMSAAEKIKAQRLARARQTSD